MPSRSQSSLGLFNLYLWEMCSSAKLWMQITEWVDDCCKKPKQPPPKKTMQLNTLPLNWTLPLKLKVTYPMCPICCCILNCNNERIITLPRRKIYLVCFITISEISAQPCGEKGAKIMWHGMPKTSRCISPTAAIKHHHNPDPKTSHGKSYFLHSVQHYTREYPWWTMPEEIQGSFVSRQKNK